MPATRQQSNLMTRKEVLNHPHPLASKKEENKKLEECRNVTIKTTVGKNERVQLQQPLQLTPVTSDSFKTPKLKPLIGKRAQKKLDLVESFNSKLKLNDDDGEDDGFPKRQVITMPSLELLENDESSPKTQPLPTSASSAPKSESKYCPLDLPMIWKSHKDRLINEIVCNENKKPKKAVPKIKGSYVSAYIKDFSSSKAETKVEKIETKKLESTVRRLKKDLSKYLGKKSESVTLMCNGEAKKLIRSKTDQSKAQIRAHTGKYPENDPESFPCSQIIDRVNWLLQRSQIVSTRVASNKKNKEEIPSIEILMRVYFKPFSITYKNLINFEFFDIEDKFKHIRLKVNNALAPDVLKMKAFSHFQKNQLEDCIYSLSESHGFYFRKNTIESHAAQAERLKRFHSSQSELEKKTEELYQYQHNFLRYSGLSITEFNKTIDAIDHEWNVVQITSLFHHLNRFGSSPTKNANTPPIFISAFVSVNNKRHPFVTFQKTPPIDEGISKLSIIDELKTVVMKNTKVNENYQGCKKTYWDERALHNEALMCLLRKVEDNWLFPWGFLLTGRIKDAKLRASIFKFFTSILSKYKLKLVNATMGAFYKLIESFSYLDENIKEIDNLAKFLKMILEPCSTSNCKLIANDILNFIGKQGDISQLTRDPTILVLDQELEELPWECLECLKHTPVTRVPSISMIYSLQMLSSLKAVKYNEEIKTSNSSYVVNPDGSLKGTQSRLEGYFSGIPSWTGSINNKMSPKVMDKIFSERSIYIYCGHGNGTSLYGEQNVQKICVRAVPLLMGCSSVAFTNYGPRSMSYSFTSCLFQSTCLSAVGFLWEVTDLDCDRVTIELAELFVPGCKQNLPKIYKFDTESKRELVSCLAEAVRLSRRAASQFLTHAGIVNYGIPVHHNHDL